MSGTTSLIGRAVAAAVALAALTLALAAGPALADKPPWAGEKGGKGHKEGHNAELGPPPKAGHFADPHRVYVRDYYDTQFRAGNCPPGLAKKNNGCMPPGQAKKWQVGHPLPRDVVFYEVPAPLVVQLGPPPVGYRYVRVN